MKINGYKIKQAIKSFEQLSDDLNLKVTAVPNSHEDRSNLLERNREFISDFKKAQMLQVKLMQLRRIQMMYNLSVSVDGNATLFDAINETSMHSKMLSKLATVLSQVVSSESGQGMNNKLKVSTTLSPSGYPPQHDEPCIKKEEVQHAIRQYKMDLTKLKNLIGYGNSIEIEMDVDEQLFSEHSWLGVFSEPAVEKSGE